MDFSFRSEDGGEEEIKPVSSSSFPFILRQDWCLQQTGEHDHVDEHDDDGEEEDDDHDADICM